MHPKSRFSSRHLTLMAAIAAWPAGIAQGQDLQHYHPSANGQGLFGVESADTLEPWRPRFGISFNHAQLPLTVQPPDGDRQDLAEYQLASHLQVAMGFLPRIDLGIDLPIALAQDGTSLYTTDGALTQHGLGDLRITPRVRVLGAPRGPFGVAIVLPFTLGTGLEEHYLGEDGLIFNTFNPQVTLGGHPGRLSWGLAAGYRWRPEVYVLYAPLNTYLTLGNEITYGAAVDFRVIEPLRAGIELQGAIGNQPTGGDSPLEVRVGARLDLLSGLSAVVGGGAGVSNGYGSPLWRAFAGLSYTLGGARSTGDTTSQPDPNADNDGDGLPNSSDRCPALPELVNGLEDTDGCPEPDKDFDGIADALDRCPLEPEDRDSFQDDDGCPDPDNDGDKFLDATDQCPNEPEDYDGFHDEDGCPEPDNDGDGLSDATDKCPNKPESQNGYQDGDGCPEPDQDRDDVPDAIDRCRKNPENLNGYKDEDGCPEPDRDRDGVPDPIDRCPQKAETVNGYRDDDGCPDKAPPATPSNTAATTGSTPAPTDTDLDGLPDMYDQCPTKAETINGLNDDDGCPEADTDGDGLTDGVDKCPNERETANGVKDDDGCPD